MISYVLLIALVILALAVTIDAQWGWGGYPGYYGGGYYRPWWRRRYYGWGGYPYGGYGGYGGGWGYPYYG